METVTFTMEQFQTIIDTLIVLCVVTGALSAFMAHLVLPSVAYGARRIRVWYRYRRNKA
ncbi:hypothetical protein [Vibrio sp. CJQ_6]|uniref:hypothetical protein n=1 Tax=Vibrio sp. CJQ_6 TaxID=3367165 RepID=UPI00370A75FD